MGRKIIPSGGGPKLWKSWNSELFAQGSKPRFSGEIQRILREIPPEFPGSAAAELEVTGGGQQNKKTKDSHDFRPPTDLEFSGGNGKGFAFFANGRGITDSKSKIPEGES